MASPETAARGNIAGRTVARAPPRAGRVQAAAPTLALEFAFMPDSGKLRQFFAMKIRRLAVSLLPLFLASGGMFAAATEKPDPGQICISVGRLLEQFHYSRHKLDAQLSGIFLSEYLKALDFNRLFFTAGDVAEFESRHATTLDDDILLGNAAPAFEIHAAFVRRAEERIAKIEALLRDKLDLGTGRTVELNRKDAPWPADAAAADQLWVDRLTGEYLQEKLSEKNGGDPIATLRKRYQQFLRNTREDTPEDVLKVFLNTLAQVYDPHSEYLSKSDLENFSITMRLSLSGIGAVLQSDEGYAKVVELVPGGPAYEDGRLKVGDRISAVAQGNGEFVDTVGMRLDKVVKMIRGQKGTVVRLKALPARSGDPATRKTVEITRDEVQLKEQEAKADIIERRGPDGTTLRLGWLTLPSFYADMDHVGERDAKSTTKDVQLLIDRLRREGVGGIAIDLRRNGGGSLEEAVNLTGLFIKKGPVVQAKDANGNIRVSRDRDGDVAYDGPLVVVTNRISASASEIFAGALQDYRRAVVVGDESTFGKGTVQTMLKIGKVIPFLGSESDEAGALKLTIQKFYRVAGGSTQLRGVTSDIRLPSLYDHGDLGEAALDHPLPYDEVEPADYIPEPSLATTIKELQVRSAARVAANPDFRYVREDLLRLKERLAANKLSLNEKVRRAEIAEDKARKEKRKTERAGRRKSDDKVFALTLDNVSKPELVPVSYDDAADKDDGGGAPGTPGDDGDDELLGARGKRARIDPVRTESLNILADLVQLARLPKTAKTP